MKTAWNRTALFIIFTVLVSTGRSDEPEQQQPVRAPIRLPGLVVDFKKRCLDLEATVCLDEGFLELVACTKGSKEHESIVAVAARPMHIHTALLLLNANSGNPAMRKEVGEQDKRWVDIPPRGDPIEAFFVIKNSQGKMIEHPMRDFVVRPVKQVNQTGVVATRTRKDKPTATVDSFPGAFLFSGSILRDNGPGPRTYLADLSGHVISIATFGDALLCLPTVESNLNGTLTWRVNPKHLPEVGTKITLRLRPKNNRNTGVNK